MDYQHLAQRAYERGDNVGAIVTLVQGIKRGADPLHEMLSFLLEIYTESIQLPGTEEDVTKAIATLDKPTRDLWLKEAFDALLEHDKAHLLTALTRSLDAHKIPRPLSEEEAQHNQSLTPESSRSRARITKPPERLANPPKQAPKSKQNSTEQTAPPNEATKTTHTSPPEEARSPWWPKLLLLVAIAAFAAVLAWGLTRSGADQTTMFDRQIEAFDASNLEAFRAAIPSKNRPPQMQERAEFLDALIEVETKPPKKEPSSATQPSKDLSPWGQSADVLRLYHNGQYEQALKKLGLLERQEPTLFVVRWTRALVSELAGEFSKAQSQYAKLTQEFPRFVQGYAAQVRLSYRLGQPKKMKALQAKLAALNEHHPYLELQALDALKLTSLILFAQPYDFPTPPVSDRFTQALTHIQLVFDAWANGSVEQTQTHTLALQGLEPDFFLSSMFEAMLSSLRGEPKGAAQHFAQVGLSPNLSAPLRLSLMGIAPQILTLSGHPDLAFALSINPPNLTAHRLHAETQSPPSLKLYQELRPTPLALSLAQIEAHPRLKELAYFSLAHTLIEAGALRDAKLLIEEIKPQTLSEPWRFELLHVLIAAKRGRIKAAKVIALRLREEGAKRDASLILAMLERNSKNNTVVTSDRRSQTSLVWQHIRLENILHQGRTKALLKSLDVLEQTPIDKVAFASLRLRALARLGHNKKATQKLWDNETKHVPSSLTVRLNLAVAAMWRADIDEAQKRFDAILATSPKHPEANWFRALLYHRSGKIRLSQPHLIRANVKELSATPRFWRELGQLHLVKGDLARAQQAFYKEVLANKRSVAALSRLGQVYAKWDTQVGRRDFSRILANYQEQSGLKRQSGELLKWLARFHGSRKGTQEGLVHINQAIKIAGPRADLLTEKALVFLANKQITKAKKLFLKAIRQDTTFAPAHFGLAQVFDAQKQYEDALLHCKQFVTLDPYNVNAQRANLLMSKLQKKLDASKTKAP